MACNLCMAPPPSQATILDNAGHLKLSKVVNACRQDLQMRLLSLFVDFALSLLQGKQIWDLGALLPAIASLSHGLPSHHVLGKKAAHSSFDVLQVLQEDDANRVKASFVGLALVICRTCRSPA